MAEHVLGTVLRAPAGQSQVKLTLVRMAGCLSCGVDSLNAEELPPQSHPLLFLHGSDGGDRSSSLMAAFKVLTNGKTH